MAYIDKYGVEFSDDRKTLVRCPKDFKGEYVIPDGVTCIGEVAFFRCKDLTFVTLPNSVTSIGDEAFWGCKGLTSIEIPNSVTSIGDSAFAFCSALTSIEIPNSVTSIGDRAFEGCEGLTSIEIPNSVTSIGESAFSGCRSLKSVFIPNSVTKIVFFAFSNCHKLLYPVYNERIFAALPTSYVGEYSIPDGIETIAGGAFFCCFRLTFVAIPNSVTSIGDCAFAECSALTNINIPNCVAYIGACILYKSNGLKNPIYHNTSLIYVPENQTGVYSVIKGTTKIVGGAFADCYALTNIKIPNSVTSIGDGAFMGCKGLTSIEIPISVTSIGNGAFSGCESLTSIIIPNSVTSIGDEAFMGCKGLISIEIPNSITSIGVDAFWGCESLSELNLPSSIISIRKRAFVGCSHLTSIIIPNSVTSIGDSAFAACKSLTSVTIPKSVTSIGDEAFSPRNSLKEIHVPLDQEERFCAMDGLKEFAEIILETSAKQKAINQRRDEAEQRRMQEQQLLQILKGSILFLGIECTGSPRNYIAPISDSNNWPRLVQLAWIMADKNGNVLKKKSVIIKPDGFSIPSDAAAVHGITTERAQREGKPLQEVLEEFATDLSLAEQVVGHNIDFDLHIMGAELYRLKMDYDALMNKPSICTMRASTDFCAIPNPNSYFGGYKWPSLQELYRRLFDRSFDDAHDAFADISATKECFFELKRRGVID